MQKLCTVKRRPGADCGSGHLLLIAKFRLELKKTRKNTRPARYDLNQMPYEFIVEIMSRFKIYLDRVSSVPEELWTKVCNVQEAKNKTIPLKRAGRIPPIKLRVPKNSWKRQESLLQ